MLMMDVASCVSVCNAIALRKLLQGGNVSLQLDPGHRSGEPHTKQKQFLPRSNLDHSQRKEMAFKIEFLAFI